ncbi:MAG: uroporphyrinogen decarboxylase family protein [Elusimicrobia bacterium]|nr:uroporphyrinogen decarboxylase family protein [Elusimicrobiota bacterium]
MTKPNPDFNRLRKVLLREGEPDRVPFFDLFIDGIFMEAVINKSFDKLDFKTRAGKEQYWKWIIEFYYQAGYDYVTEGIGEIFPRSNRLKGQDTASSTGDTRTWQDEHHGAIENRQDFEKYPWNNLKPINLSHFEFMSKNLPDGMMLIPCGPGGVLENVMWLMGYEPMSYAIYEDPQLIQDMFDKVGGTLVKTFETLCQLDKVGAMAVGDDMGFKTQTMFSPKILRKYVFPWQKKIVEVAHKHNLPFILHSCGMLDNIMDDLIDDVGIDAKHSYEDVIMPVTEAKKKYGNRVAIMGGVDMDKLSSLPVDKFRLYVRNIIKECAPGGNYALGSGNSLANYVKVENYLAMLDEGLKYGKYPIGK